MEDLCCPGSQLDLGGQMETITYYPPAQHRPCPMMRNTRVSRAMDPVPTSRYVHTQTLRFNTFCLKPPTHQWPKTLNAPLIDVDPELFDIIEHEKNRQWKVGLHVSNEIRVHLCASGLGAHPV